MTEQEQTATEETIEEQPEEPIYANRQAVFDAAHLIMDASDCYEGETRIKKWAIILAAHSLNGNGKTPKPTKARFNLTEDDLVAARAKAKETVTAIKAKESLAEEEERKHAEWVRENTPIACEPPTKAMMEAQDVYESGKFIEYCMTTFHKNWYGDDAICKVILLQGANTRVMNNKTGINLHISGNAQEGKTDLARRGGRLLNPVDWYDGNFTRYALYSDQVHDNQTLFSDDTAFDEDTASTVRGILTAYEDGCSRITMENKVWVTKKTPKHLQLILTSVDSVSSKDSQNQDDSRYISIDLKRDEETNRIVFKMLQQDSVDVSYNMEVIHAVWDLIEPREVAIHREFKPEEVPSPLFRDATRFFGLLRCHALLNNRDTTNEDDVDAICGIINMSRLAISSNMAGLSPSEKLVLSAIKTECAANGRCSVSDIMANINSSGTKIAIGSVYRALYGHEGTWTKITGGLLSKTKLRVEINPDTHTNQLLF